MWPVTVPFVWSDAVLSHEPMHEVWVGKETPGTEVPYRAHLIRDALTDAGHAELPAAAHDDEVLLTVHEAPLVDWLRSSSASWAEGPYEELVGQPRVVPYVFPTPMMTAGMPWRYPGALHARAGVWCYDTMTPVGPGTWEAARAAVDCALTAVDLVVAGGHAAAYALCRPPGHHAAPAGFGGSCYLNNAAVAAQALTRHGMRVAVLDLDAHHGNGTQAVFWQRGDVFYGSVHVDPAAGWFPHVLGHADETGDGEGKGATLNVPLAPGTRDVPWMEAVARICESALQFGVDAVVVSLGVDAAGVDPESPLQVTDAGFGGAGRLLAALELPTVLVQEGGYHLPSLGPLVRTVLAGFDGLS
jgi:acetoin utilization deacetylase AcuC-like enzyme